MYIVQRSTKNPLLTPSLTKPWEAIATLNGCPIQKGGETYLLYRGIGRTDPLFSHGTLPSVIGIARKQEDGIFREEELFIEGAEWYDKYACEDPRVTFFEGKYYIFYTAISGAPFNASNIKVACAISSDLKTIDERHLVTPFNSKAMTLFPERINGKVTILFTAHTDEPPAKIAIAQADSVEEFFDEEYWRLWHDSIDEMTISLSKSPDDHSEVGAPPLLTEKGWLLVYSRAQHYFEEGKRLFTIEAVILDKDDPRKILSRTSHPIMTPETSYEEFGLVRKVIFPSGLLYDTATDVLDIYYGAGDTVCAKASLILSDLLASMDGGELFERALGGPTLKPMKDHEWENVSVFNPTAVLLDDTHYILYRSMGTHNTSVIGLAISKDGIAIDERLPEPIYIPRENFEMKKDGEYGFSGCEDPRATVIGNIIYMLYTAYDGINPPKVAITSISISDFLQRKWGAWTKPHLISPNDISDKDACILPEKINGKYMLIHRIDPQMCADYVSSISPIKDIHLSRCHDMLQPRTGFWDGAKVGIACTPIKVAAGWLLFYHGVSEHAVYSVGMALLDIDDPTTVIARAVEPVIYPLESYEKEGVIPNVVFPCGAIVRGDTIFLYYGGADTVVHVATCSLSRALNILQPSSLIS